MTRRAISTTVIVLVVIAVVVIAGVGYYLLSQPASNPGPTLKVAAVLPGLANDGDYNTLGYLAMSKLANDTGAVTAYSENVAVADVGTKMEQYIGNGYSVIWAHGAQFNTAIGLTTNDTGLAAKYPNVTFIAETDAPVANQRANVWILDRNFAIGYYAIGYAAALATQTNKIAYIGGVQLPFSNAEANAAIMAAKAVNPNIQVYRFWSSNFNDPVGAKTQAQSMIALGVDVIMSSTNLGVFGIMQAVNGTNVLVTTKYTDKLSYAPSNYITSYIYDFSAALEHVYKAIQGGTTTGYYKITFTSNSTSNCYIQLPLHNVASTVNSKVSDVVNALLNGTIVVPFNSTAPGPGP
ncbi:MAG TPA: BMP family ABC transporter substrate-binding protein [Conexivisphaerales archaeon]|nr:BMP family ABC transporter substrate-binding protein [Conexivisphaerales archaeon]